jgi:hypothetical protein
MKKIKNLNNFKSFILINLNFDIDDYFDYQINE